MTVTRREALMGGAAAMAAALGPRGEVVAAQITAVTKGWLKQDAL